MRIYQLPEAGKIENLRLAEAETPEPMRKQVLVRIKAASLNYRDLLVARGTYGRSALPTNLIPLSDGAGEVVAVGADVKHFKQGDRVAGIFHQNYLAGEITDEVLGSSLGGDIDGVLAEFRVFEEHGLVKIPEHLSYEEAATLPCAAVTAWNALFGLRRIGPGDTVLTLGSGGVSVFALQFAHHAGARVIATSSSDEKLLRLKELGADELINYKKTPDWEREVLELTGGRGVDNIVEVGGAGTLPRSLSCVRRGGSVNVIGLLAGTGDIDPMIVLGKSIIMRGIFVGSRETFAEMNRGISRNRIKPIIDRVFPFEETVDAYKHLESGKHFGKIVVQVTK